MSTEHTEAELKLTGDKDILKDVLDYIIDKYDEDLQTSKIKLVTCGVPIDVEEMNANLALSQSGDPEESEEDEEEEHETEEDDPEDNIYRYPDVAMSGCPSGSIAFD